jgi:hypothetical protein
MILLSPIPSNIMANIAQIKTTINVPTLELNTSQDANNQPTDWMRHWDNEARISVSIHKDLVAELQADITIASLGLQTETRTGAKGSYVSHRIVKYAPAEATF